LSGPTDLLHAKATASQTEHITHLTGGRERKISRIIKSKKGYCQRKEKGDVSGLSNPHSLYRKREVVQL